MGIINRIFLFFYALTVSVLLGLVAMAAFQVVPENEWIVDLRYVFGRHEFFTGLGVLSIFSLYFILCALLVKRETEDELVAETDIVLLQGKEGEVKVSAEAVKKVVEKEAMSAHSVREATASVFKVKNKREDGLLFRLSLELTILIGAEVAAVSADVKSRVQRQLNRTLGISEVPMEIKIAEITNAPVENNTKRVV
jgi:hypothetical protein